MESAKQVVNKALVAQKEIITKICAACVPEKFNFLQETITAL